MPSLQSAMNAIPGGGRVYYSARWLRRLLRLWRDPNRQFLAYPPGHFCSPLPNVDELRRDHQRLSDTSTASLPGIDLNVSEQLERLASFQRLFAEQRFEENATPGQRYSFENAFFTYSDALFLYAMLRDLRSKRVVEIGSGFSSALMLDVRDQFLECKPELTFIEPYPTRLNTLLTPADRQSCTVLEQRVQDVPFERFDALEANDILFIDSSHVSKIGSDVNHLFFEILPRLRPGVVVHIHDIFWPFEYPRSWYDLGWAWNETYLLRAMLQGHRDWKILLFSSYLEAHHATELTNASPLLMSRAKATPTTGGSSIWLRKHSHRD